MIDKHNLILFYMVLWHHIHNNILLISTYRKQISTNHNQIVVSISILGVRRFFDICPSWFSNIFRFAWNSLNKLNYFPLFAASVSLVALRVVLAGWNVRWELTGNVERFSWLWGVWGEVVRGGGWCQCRDSGSHLVITITHLLHSSTLHPLRHPPPSRGRQ